MRMRITDRAGNPQRGWSLIESLAAIVVVGIGITLFAKVQRMTSRDSSVNSKTLLAGKMIENYLEDTRIYIAKTKSNSPAYTGWTGFPTSIAASPANNNIKLVCTVSTAYSPKDGATVLDVRKLDIVTTWTSPYADTLKVTTYVSKKF